MFRRKNRLKYQVVKAVANPRVGDRARLKVPKMTPDQITLMIEVELISGDFESLLALDVYITDEYNVRSDSQVTGHNAESTVAMWGFAVDKDSRDFVVHFPDGKTEKIGSQPEDLNIDAVSAFLYADSPTEMQQVLDQYPELLTNPGHQRRLESLAEEIRSRDDMSENSYKVVKGRTELLRRLVEEHTQR